MSETDAAECSSYGRRLRPMSDPDLITWLRARLDDEERVARAAGAGQDRDGAGVWTRECGHVDWEGETQPPGHDQCCVVAGDIRIYDEGGHDPEQAEHIARQDPAATLARIAAHRRILDRHTGPGHRCDPYDDDGHIDTRNGVCADVRDLASAYADQPGWREEWQ